jgi:hypothetical protein
MTKIRTKFYIFFNFFLLLIIFFFLILGGTMAHPGPPLPPSLTLGTLIRQIFFQGGVKESILEQPSVYPE